MVWLLFFVWCCALLLGSDVVWAGVVWGWLGLVWEWGEPFVFGRVFSKGYEWEVSEEVPRMSGT